MLRKSVTLNESSKAQAYYALRLRRDDAVLEEILTILVEESNQKLWAIALLSVMEGRQAQFDEYLLRSETWPFSDIQTLAICLSKGGFTFMSLMSNLHTWAESASFAFKLCAVILLSEQRQNLEKLTVLHACLVHSVNAIEKEFANSSLPPQCSFLQDASECLEFLYNYNLDT